MHLTVFHFRAPDLRALKLQVQISATIYIAAAMKLWKAEVQTPTASRRQSLPLPTYSASPLPAYLSSIGLSSIDRSGASYRALEKLARHSSLLV